MTVKETAAFLRQHDNYLILTHKRPDGDTIGCAAALDHLVPHDAFDADTGEAPHKNLFRVGFVSALAMALHNFPEGVATFLFNLPQPWMRQGS